jgi:hypothetical protein
MVRPTVMGLLRPAMVAGWLRPFATSTVSGSLGSPSPHAPLARRARSTEESSDDALAAAAWAGWCEPAALAAGPDLPSATPVERAEAARAADGGRARLVTCGLWLARRRLVAAVVGPGDEARRIIRTALTDDARFGLVEYLAAAGAELVATEALARMDLTPVQAARRGLAVWTAGDALVAALLRVAAIRDPARAAALLARLPVIPLLRGSIRRLVSPDRRQLPLL